MTDGPGLRFVVVVDNERVDDEIVSMDSFVANVCERQAELCRQAQEAGKPWRVEVRDPDDDDRLYAVLPSGMGLLN